MIRCNQCKAPSARIVTQRELAKLSNTHFTGAVVATTATAAAAATAASTTAGAVGVTALAAKAASNSGGGVLGKLAMVAATAAASALGKMAIDRLSAGSGKLVYCSICGHQEPLKKGG
ncbi:hypothetical protein RTH46_21980 [Pseudomonas sp. zfem004]|uniref:hypothetical protein n=1 Tax=Pseudomonas sp. zfem004 TaxID=3078199 RepID=UPI00292950C4|nr:hypothetical protein [Pseudomonas sp. zfem004]MDU9405160.1 hypothetical protein [Pseudomonas sp. zfem004]